MKDEIAKVPALNQTGLRDKKPAMVNSFAPFEIIEGPRDRGLVLLCDHARNTLPEPYGTLGLPAESFERHIAYDIGAEAVTRGLAARLGVPAVHSCFSRLLIDPNRGPDDPTIVMGLSDGEVIPGNHPLPPGELAHRLAHYHQPYHDAVDEMVSACMEAGPPPIIFSIHSFTPHWKGAARPWHATMLWDSDPRMARHILDGLVSDARLCVASNEPYDGCLKNDTIYRHATAHGLSNGLIEIRQDLIADEAGAAQWVDRLAPLLEEALQQPNLRERRRYGSRADGRMVSPSRLLDKAAMADYTPW
ncbi:MAG: N-formylglutamate amidohydrolase [Pseudomonadota bacterium]